jgi:hypothetical protein
MLNLVDIMDLYLDKENIKNKEKYKEFKGWHSASSAGQCHKRQFYKLNEYEEEPFDRRIKRLLDLGTVVHKRFEDSINWYNHEYINLDTSVIVMTEQKVIIPGINVVGHLDAVHINLDTQSISLYDLKTIGDWPWKMRFGKTKKGNVSNRYYLQVGTYVLGLKELYPNYDYDMSIVWYNKNNSMMKEQKIYPEWSEEALIYWKDLDESIGSADEGYYPEEIVTIPPHEAPNVPVEKWECDYCNFSKQCKSDIK